MTQQFEYRAIPAPERAEKIKGLKTGRERLAHSINELINKMAAEGWEYQRADSLPCEERRGLTGRVTNFYTMLIFRRALRQSAPAGRLDAQPRPDAAAAPSVSRPEDRIATAPTPGRLLANPRNRMPLPAAPVVPAPPVGAHGAQDASDLDSDPSPAIEAPRAQHEAVEPSTTDRNADLQDAVPPAPPKPEPQSHAAVPQDAAPERTSPADTAAAQDSNSPLPAEVDTQRNVAQSTTQPAPQQASAKPAGPAPVLRAEKGGVGAAPARRLFVGRGVAAASGLKAEKRPNPKQE